MIACEIVIGQFTVYEWWCALIMQIIHTKATIIEHKVCESKMLIEFCKSVASFDATECAVTSFQLIWIWMVAITRAE